jgi:hypothetical protein
MEKVVTVETDAGPVQVRKLALYDYAELLRALKKLPQEVGKFIESNSAEDLKNNETLFAVMPGLVADALPEFCAVLSCCTDKDADFHGRELDLADNLEILAAALSLNDYQKIMGAIKKIRAPRTQPVEAEIVEPSNPPSES